MSAVNELRTAAERLEERAAGRQRWGSSRWRMLTQDGMIEGRRARTAAVEDRAVAVLLRAIDEGARHSISEAALAVARVVVGDLA